MLDYFAERLATAICRPSTNFLCAHAHRNVLLLVSKHLFGGGIKSRWCSMDYCGASAKSKRVPTAVAVMPFRSQRELPCPDWRRIIVHGRVLHENTRRRVEPRPRRVQHQGAAVGCDYPTEHGQMCDGDPG